MEPIILAILDGWGLSSSIENNAIAQAKTPNLKELEKNYPTCSLQASGIAVGLPWDEGGNSEVGHISIGSGRVVYQYLPRISLEIKNKKFFKNQALVKALIHVKKNNSTLHLMGLVSSGTVHSHLEHIYGLLELARQSRIKKVYLHVFTDGKDAPLKEGKKIVADLQEKIKNPNWKIASLIGRFYAMDRNKNWDRTEKTYNLLTKGQGEKTQDPVKKLEEFYEQNITDTNIKPIVVVDSNQKPVGLIKENDSIIFFNFREDSARQLTKAFVLKDFNGFPRQWLKNLYFCTMSEYEKGLPVKIAYPPIEIKNHLTEVLSQHNKKVLKIAETEKYAHVSCFFNGGKEKPYPGEIRQLIPSKVVVGYDQVPEMQADRLTEAIIQGVRNKYDLIVANYANTDMVGHTGNLTATIRAVEFLDKSMKFLIDLAEKGECILIIISDHGNAEEMVNPRTGELITEHTNNPVPFYLVGKEFKREKPALTKPMTGKPQGILCDIAPTILELMKIPNPPEMTGRSLLSVLK
jgi:2,3-bisphosphoglycerate-independent phosphoglycerate mutase